MVMSLARLGLVAVGLFTVSGCSPLVQWLDFDMRKPIPWTTAHNEYQRGPVSVVAYWSETNVQSPQGQAIRGFGGRVMFVDPESGVPGLARGTLTVYAFDEYNRQPGDHRPTRKYVFEPQHLEKLRTDNEFGPSYNVWLPWDDVGGPEMTISLVARFQPEGEGPVSLGESSRSHLSGPKPLPHQLAKEPPGGGGIRQTSLEGAASQPVAPEREVANGRNLRTTTIGSTVARPVGQGVPELNVPRQLPRDHGLSSTHVNTTAHPNALPPHQPPAKSLAGSTTMPHGAPMPHAGPSQQGWPGPHVGPMQHAAPMQQGGPNQHGPQPPHQAGVGQVPEGSRQQEVAHAPPRMAPPEFAPPPKSQSASPVRSLRPRTPSDRVPPDLRQTNEDRLKHLRSHRPASRIDVSHPWQDP